jgi:hypothetical protein
MKTTVAHIRSSRPKTIREAQKSKRYWDKIAIETPEGVFTTTSEDRAIQLTRRFQRKYPHKPPVLGYIPRGDMIMLF